MPRILVIEDNAELLAKLKRKLEQDGFTTDAVSDGTLGLGMLQQYQYDVAVIDWDLPGLPGPEVIRRFRESGGITPVLMLTGKDEMSDKVIGFESGTDDYLTKPFNPDELVLRLRALLRRAPGIKSNILQLGALVLDTDTTSAKVNDKPLNLQRLEYRLLEFLMRHKGHTFDAETLLDRVWPADSDASIETVRGYIKTLRRKLSETCDRPHIRNIYGLGYKIDMDD